MSPLVIQESFEAGLPVIASKVYGNLEHIKHKMNGLLFDFNSAADFATQLRLLIENSSLLREMKKNIKPPTNFSEVGEMYLQIYNSGKPQMHETLPV
jgi:glycosyltransferase involved in cell wall biosynthesis